jgi:tetratricopeptide (TPR) repeat protein
MSTRQAPDPAADYSQAVALHHAGQHAEAQRLYRAILKRAPVHADALHLLGLSLCQTGRHTEALTFLSRALLQRPQWVEALINRGNALQELGQPERALADFDAALALQPDHPEALGNRGVTLYALGRLEEAVADYDRALARRPAYPEALHNRGNALRALNRNGEAIACFEAALALQPDDAEARLHLAMSHLLEGDYPAAWPDYQWRWKTRQYAPQRRVFPQPEWLGHRALDGRTILVHAEQGYGDTLQFCRYVAPLRDLGATVVLEVQPALKRLLQGLEGSGRVLARGEPLPDFDVHCPLLSLPGAFDTTLATIPARLPYLSADPALTADWAGRLGARESMRVGLVWSGNPTHLNDHNRSAPLADYAEVLALPCAFVSLQKALRKMDQEELRRRPQILHFGERLADFADTAAVAAQLDLVITVDTAVAHLAGAMGKPTWVLLPYAPDWRWLLERRDSPWYPGMRLFRQTAPGDWRGVMAEVAAELRALAGSALR